MPRSHASLHPLIKFVSLHKPTAKYSAFCTIVGLNRLFVAADRDGLRLALLVRKLEHGLYVICTAGKPAFGAA